MPQSCKEPPMGKKKHSDHIELTAHLPQKDFDFSARKFGIES